MTEVASLRQSKQAVFNLSFRPSYENVVIDPSALPRIPHTFTLFLRARELTEVQHIQETLTMRYGNVSSQNFLEEINFSERTLQPVIQAVQFTSFFILGAGALVLVATLAASRFSRIHEGALLRALGATRDQLLRVLNSREVLSQPPLEVLRAE